MSINEPDSQVSHRFEYQFLKNIILKHTRLYKQYNIESGFSAAAKALWSTSMIKELDSNMAISAEKLAKVLIFEYNEDLDESAIEFLHHEYGANINNLIKLNQEKSVREPYQSTALSVTILQNNPQWNHAILCAERSLGCQVS